MRLEGALSEAVRSVPSRMRLRQAVRQGESGIRTKGLCGLGGGFVGPRGDPGKPKGWLEIPRCVSLTHRCRHLLATTARVFVFTTALASRLRLRRAGGGDFLERTHFNWRSPLLAKANLAASTNTDKKPMLWVLSCRGRHSSEDKTEAFLLYNYCYISRIIEPPEKNKKLIIG